ncbi:MAG: GMC family oxidoreductase N-terminal domain-containing protein [Pseudomonadota bacterium]
MASGNAEEFDYVIVGAGAAGCVLANRLSEDAGVTVCVLESGPPDRNPFIHIPAGFIKTLFDPGVTWQFKTEPTENTGGRPIATTQGRTLGGSSSINGLIYNRGQPDDLNGWAQRGNRGWGYADMLPYFLRTERRIGFGEADKRGREGRLPVTDMDWFHPLSEAFIAGAVASGIPRNPDYNSGDQAGVGYYQRLIEKGRRISAARAFLKPVLGRRNLDVRTLARAEAILLEGKRAVGIRYRHDVDRGAAPREVRARREVILCSGTVNTARLLQVSGIGPGALLADIGAPVLHELPGVGANFRDHYAVRFVMRAKKGVTTLNELSRGVSLGGQIARWALRRPSILATSPSHVHVFWNGADDPKTPPDVQCVFTPGSYAEGKVYILDDYPGVTAGAWQHRPQSHGHVKARSRDVFQDPSINPNYLSDPLDWPVLLGGMKLIRRLLHRPEIGAYLEGESLPGDGVQGEDELRDYARRNGSTTYHLIGTAKMGPASDPMAVVDDTLCVHGLNGLRVADASIMPAMVSANTYATTLAIAEKAADMVRGRAAPSLAA